MSRALWQALRLHSFRFSTGYRLVAKWLFSGVARIWLAGKKNGGASGELWERPAVGSLQIFSFNWLCGCQRRRVFFFEPCSSHSAWVYVICVIYEHYDLTKKLSVVRKGTNGHGFLIWTILQWAKSLPLSSSILISPREYFYIRNNRNKKRVFLQNTSMWSIRFFFFGTPGN